LTREPGRLRQTPVSLAELRAARLQQRERAFVILSFSDSWIDASNNCQDSSSAEIGRCSVLPRVLR
jgi:hypothetical protein